MKRRLLRGLDVKFVLSLVALLISATICWGFVQRGQHITEAERSVTQLSGQVGSLIAENKRLHRQLARGERVAAARSRQAAREREALRLELLRLINFLRARGIEVPVHGSSYGTPRVTTGSPSAPVSSSPQHQGGSQHHHGGSNSGGSGGPVGSGGYSGPGNSGSHANGHAHGHGHSHHGHKHNSLLPAVPNVPDLPL